MSCDAARYPALVDRLASRLDVVACPTCAPLPLPHAWCRPGACPSLARAHRCGPTLAIPGVTPDTFSIESRRFALASLPSLIVMLRRSFGANLTSFAYNVSSMFVSQTPLPSFLPVPLNVSAPDHDHARALCWETGAGALRTFRQKSSRRCASRRVTVRRLAVD
jgi:hypothetical protein